MFVWKHIDLDPVEIERVRKAYLAVKYTPNHFFQTMNLGLTEFMGMPLFRTVLIKAQPNSTGIIHKDWRPNDHNVLAINFALENCENSITEFWETDQEETKVEYTSSKSPFVGYDRTRCTKIDEYKLDSPVIFRTDIPHSVDNYSDKVRTAVSLRFIVDPWHLVSVL